MTIKELFAGVPSTEEMIQNAVAEQRALLDTEDGIRKIIEEAVAKWPIAVEGDEAETLMLCASCYLYGMEIAHSNVKDDLDIFRANYRKTVEANVERIGKIEKGYYAIDSAQRLHRCFMEFIETAMAGIIQATTEREKAAQADELVEGLHIHLEELYVGNDLIEKGIAELDEAMVYYRQKRQEVAE